MSQLAAAKSLPGPCTDPKPIRWTRDEYYRLAELGFFRGQRVELIEGAIHIMSPQNAAHTMGIFLGEEALERAFGAGFYVRVQVPLVLGATTEPEPDLAVVPGEPRQYLSHPTGALLVVEISDSTIAYDTQEKASLYAASGIADYWVADVDRGQVIVFRDPQPDVTQAFAWRYGVIRTMLPGDTIVPLSAPNNPVAVADLLP